MYVLFTTVVNTTARRKVYNCIVPITTSVRACVRVCVRACVRACVHGCVRGCVRGPLTYSKSLIWPSIQKGCGPLAYSVKHDVLLICEIYLGSHCVRYVHRHMYIHFSEQNSSLQNTHSHTILLLENCHPFSPRQ